MLFSIPSDSVPFSRGLSSDTLVQTCHMQSLLDSHLYPFLSYRQKDYIIECSLQISCALHYPSTGLSLLLLRRSFRMSGFGTNNKPNQTKSDLSNFLYDIVDLIYSLVCKTRVCHVKVYPR